MPQNVLFKGMNKTSNNIPQQSNQNPIASSGGETAGIPNRVITPSNGGFESPHFTYASDDFQQWKDGGFVNLTKEGVAKTQQEAAYLKEQATLSKSQKKALISKVNSQVTINKNVNETLREVLKGELKQHKENNKTFDVADKVSTEYQLEQQKRRENFNYISNKAGFASQRMATKHQQRMQMLNGG